MAEDLEERKRAEPAWATSIGDRRFDDRLPDATAAARARRQQAARARLAALRELESDSLDAELLAWELELRLAEARFETWQMSACCVTAQNGGYTPGSHQWTGDSARNRRQVSCGGPLSP